MKRCFGMAGLMLAAGLLQPRACFAINPFAMVTVLYGIPCCIGYIFSENVCEDGHWPKNENWKSLCRENIKGLVGSFITHPFVHTIALGTAAYVGYLPAVAAPAVMGGVGLISVGLENPMRTWDPDYSDKLMVQVKIKQNKTKKVMDQGVKMRKIRGIYGVLSPLVIVTAIAIGKYRSGL